jgi:hypothetical protein
VNVFVFFLRASALAPNACYHLNVASRARRGFRPVVSLLGAGCIALAAAAGCGASDRPPPSGDYVPSQAHGSGNGPILFDAAPIVPTCNLGPEGGVCACADEPLLEDAPNLYFILDTSGSMAVDNKWGLLSAALTKLIIELGPRVKVGVAIWPNPQVSTDSCAPGIEVFPPRRGDAPAGTQGPVATALLRTLEAITPRGGDPSAVTLQQLLPYLQRLPGQTYVILGTDGGLNCDAAATCTADGCTINIEGDQGCPPGGPKNCCTDPAIGDPRSCLDAQPNLQAVQALAHAGIPVYVLGIPGAPGYVPFLNELAQAGQPPPSAAEAGLDASDASFANGQGEAGQPPSPAHYYAITATDQDAFYAAISKIAAHITGNCTLSLNNPPTDPDLVNVFLDKQVLPQAGADGWTLDGTTVTISGASCQKILDGDILDVRVVAGCPTVTL